MIDSYDNLPDVMVFMHNGRYQWHNDDPLYGKWHRSFNAGFAQLES